MARQPRARRSGGRCSRSTSTTRSRPAPPTAPACSPARSAIDTGTLVKGFRGRSSTPARRAPGPARRRGAGTGSRRLARAGLRAGEAVSRVAGEAPLRGASRAGRAALSDELVPEWREEMPPAAAPPCPRRPATAPPPSTCRPASTGSSAAPGPTGPGPSLPEAMVEVSARAAGPGLDPPGRRRHLLRGALELEGVRGRARASRPTEMVERLRALERRGGAAGGDRRHLLRPRAAEPAGVLARERRAPRSSTSSTRSPGRERLLPRLEPETAGRLGHRPPDLLDPPPGPRRGAWRALAGALAEEVHVPVTATCCGFAGDRGFLHPELTARRRRRRPPSWRLRGLHGGSFDAYLSTNRTCEVGLERATGQPYESVSSCSRS